MFGHFFTSVSLKFSCKMAASDSDISEAFGYRINCLSHETELGFGTESQTQSDVSVSPMNTSDLSDFSDPGSNDSVLKIINSAPAKSCELDVCVHACVCTCGVHARR